MKSNSVPFMTRDSVSLVNPFFHEALAKMANILEEFRRHFARLRQQQEEIREQAREQALRQAGAESPPQQAPGQHTEANKENVPPYRGKF